MSSTPPDVGTLLFAGIASFFTLILGAKKGIFQKIGATDVWKIPLRGFHVLGVFLIYFTASFLTPTLLGSMLKARLALGKMNAASIAIASWLNFFNSAIILISLFFFSRIQRSKIWKLIWKRPGLGDSYAVYTERNSRIGEWQAIAFAIFAWVVSFPLVVFLNQLLDWCLAAIFHIDLIPEQLAVIFLKMTLGHPLYLFLALTTILFFAPVIEEILFRGYLQTYIRQHWGAKKAILLSSLFFSFFHYAPEQGIGNIPVIGSLFVFSLFLGICYEKKGALIGSISLHALFNAVNVASLYLFGKLPFAI